MSQDINQLVRRIAEAQDREAFIAVFGYYAPRVKSYLMRMNLAEDVAEDVTQEVMSQLWRKAHLFDPGKAAFSTWLFRIARNRLIDMRRRDRSGLLDEHDPFFQPEPTVGPDEAVGRAQSEERVRTLINALPEEQRQLLMLSFFEGMSHGQISAVTGQPLGTVKSRIRLALLRLRKEVEDHEAPHLAH